MSESASGRLEATARSFGWQALDSARDQRYTGALVIDVGEEIRLFFDVGVLYLAERAIDPPLPDRLVAVGVVSTDELASGTVEVNGVTVLGRLFDRAPSVDRDRVAAAIELMNDEVVASMASREVRSAEALPYRHHPSGIQRWSDESPTAPATTLEPPAEPAELHDATEVPVRTVPSAGGALPPPVAAVAVGAELPVPVAPIASPGAAPGESPDGPSAEFGSDERSIPEVVPDVPVMSAPAGPEPASGEPVVSAPSGPEVASGEPVIPAPSGPVLASDEPVIPAPSSAVLASDAPEVSEIPSQPEVSAGDRGNAVVDPAADGSLIRPLEVPGFSADAGIDAAVAESAVVEPALDPHVVDPAVVDPAVEEPLIRPLEVPGSRSDGAHPEPTVVEPSPPAPVGSIRSREGLPNLPTGAERRKRRDLEISADWTVGLGVDADDPDDAADADSVDEPNERATAAPAADGTDDRTDDGPPPAPPSAADPSPREPTIEIVWPSGDIDSRTAADAPAVRTPPIDRPMPGASARLAVGRLQTSDDAAFAEPAPPTAASEAVVFEIDWSLGATPAPAPQPQDETAADVLDDVMHAVRRTVTACETRVARAQEPPRSERLGSLARLGGVMPAHTGQSVFDEVLAPSLAVPTGQQTGEDRSGALKRLIGSLKRP